MSNCVDAAAAAPQAPVIGPIETRRTTPIQTDHIGRSRRPSIAARHQSEVDYKRKYEESEKEIKSLRKSCEELTKERFDNVKMIAKLRESNNELKGRTSSMSHAADDQLKKRENRQLIVKKNQLEAEVVGLTDKVNDGKEELRSLQAEIEHNTIESNNLRGTIEKQYQEQDRLQDKISTLETQRADLQKQITDAEATYHAKAKEKAELDQLVAQLQPIASNMKVQQDTIEHMEEAIKSKKDEHATLVTNLEAVKTKIAESTDNLNKLKKENDEQEDRNNKLVKDGNRVRANLETVKGEYDSLLKQINNLTSQLSALVESPEEGDHGLRQIKSEEICVPDIQTKMSWLQKRIQDLMAQKQSLEQQIRDLGCELSRADDEGKRRLAGLETQIKDKEAQLLHIEHAYENKKDEVYAAKRHMNQPRTPQRSTEPSWPAEYDMHGRVYHSENDYGAPPYFPPSHRMLAPPQTYTTAQPRARQSGNQYTCHFRPPPGSQNPSLANTASTGYGTTNSGASFPPAHSPNHMGSGAGPSDGRPPPEPSYAYADGGYATQWQGPDDTYS